MKLLVILHVHYEEQIDYFLEKLSVISGCDWDLIVSSSRLGEGMKKKFSSFKPGVRFVSVENAGYDIWPFIKVINAADIFSYDLIMKLHTKNRRNYKTHLNGCTYRGFGWRNELVDSLLGSPGRFSEVLKAFDNPHTGMVCSRKLYMELGFSEDRDMLDKEMQRIGIDFCDRRFCLGTMFVVRPECLRILKEQPYSVQMFAGESHSGDNATLAHVYERILGILPTVYGFCVSPVSDPSFERRKKVKAVVDPFLKWIFAIDKDYDWKKYIRLFGFKFYLS